MKLVGAKSNETAQLSRVHSRPTRVPPIAIGTVQFFGVHNLSNRVLLAANCCSGEAECTGRLVLMGPVKSLVDNVANLKSRRTSRIWPTVALACRLKTARQYWHRFNGSSSSSSAIFMFCFDVIARDAAEPGRSRITRPERYRRSTALLPYKALGCAHTAAAHPGLTVALPLNRFCCVFGANSVPLKA